mmetsp:Transcript_5283/g.17063  ORF Transcript_5283/g.17063 Transcript_5283/m.17063 type:complete len:513 (+) Transcript_5283:218-1756(+)
MAERAAGGCCWHGCDMAAPQAAAAPTAPPPPRSAGAPGACECGLVLRAIGGWQGCLGGLPLKSALQAPRVARDPKDARLGDTSRPWSGRAQDAGGHCMGEWLPVLGGDVAPAPTGLAPPLIRAAVAAAAVMAARTVSSWIRASAASASSLRAWNSRRRATISSFSWPAPRGVAPLFCAREGLLAEPPNSLEERRLDPATLTAAFPGARNSKCGAGEVREAGIAAAASAPPLGFKRTSLPAVGLNSRRRLGLSSSPGSTEVGVDGVVSPAVAFNAREGEERPLVERTCPRSRSGLASLACELMLAWLLRLITLASSSAAKSGDDTRPQPDAVSGIERFAVDGACANSSRWPLTLGVGTPEWLLLRAIGNSAEPALLGTGPVPPPGLRGGGTPSTGLSRTSMPASCQAAGAGLRHPFTIRRSGLELPHVSGAAPPGCAVPGRRPAVTLFGLRLTRAASGAAGGQTRSRCCWSSWVSTPFSASSLPMISSFDSATVLTAAAAEFSAWSSSQRSFC